jgi:hypothetical protein
MATMIKCPSCSFDFPLEEALNDELKDTIEKEKAELRQKMASHIQTKENEFKKQEAALQLQLLLKDKEIDEKLLIEKNKLQHELQESIRKSVTNDFENQLSLLKQADAEKAEKLKESQRKELDYLQKEQALKIKEEELQLTLQRQLMAEREKLKEQLQKEEIEKTSIREQEFQLREKELLKQLDDQKKLAEEMKRKADQGSMQLQGEVQELLLEEILKTTFPYDTVAEVGKGVRGADCIQTVRNNFGVEAGKIIYESKRTKDFSNEWIEKLKSDMRTLGADVAIIVTQTLPKEMDRFGEKDGVYICTFSEVRSVALLLRNGLLKIYDAKKSQDNKGDKMVMLYDYLTSNEFGEQWNAIREGFMNMKISIQRERDTMEKLWKAREKQLEKVLLNAAHIKGSVEGIAGADAVNLSISDDDEPLLLD